MWLPDWMAIGPRLESAHYITEEYLRFITFRECCGNDAFDHLSLGLRISIHVRPLFGGEFTFDLLVSPSVLGIRAQAVSESQISLNLRTTGGVDMDMNVLVSGPEHAVLIPIGLPYTQDVTCSFQLGQISGLIRRTWDYNKNVNDGLSPKTRHRG